MIPILILVLMAIAGLSGSIADPRPGPAQTPIFAVKGEVLVTNRLDVDFSKYQVTFLELGADRCIPCKKMQPIMKEIAAMFPDRIQVVFYDVWKDSARPRNTASSSFRPRSFWIRRARRSPATSGSFPKRRSSSS